MSDRGPSRRATRRHTVDGNCSKVMLHVDLNDPLPAVESWQSEVISVLMHLRTSRRTAAPANPQHDEGSTRQQAPPPWASDGLSTLPIDVEAIEDEVEFLFSSRGFSQARKRPRRNHLVVIDEESENHLHSSENLGTTSSRDSRTKRQRTALSRTVIDCEGSSSEDDHLGKSNKGRSCPEPQKVLPPKEPIFSCPICMNMLVEASSTICGHIFCQKCIKYAIQVGKRCPTCRKKLTMSNIHRVYLPTAD